MPVDERASGAGAASGTPVTVYSTATCGWCRRAEELLSRHRIPFETVDVTGDRRARAALAERAHWRTVPVIFVEGRAIGGYQELAALVNAGALAHLSTPRSNGHA